MMLALYMGLFTGCMTVLFGIASDNPNTWTLNFPCGFLAGFLVGYLAHHFMDRS